MIALAFSFAEINRAFAIGNTVSGPAEVQLLQLANDYFKDQGGLSSAEITVFKTVSHGTVADFRRKSGKVDDPDLADRWSDDRIVRANRLEWLCTDAEASRLVSARGVQIVGARIKDKFDLSQANMSFPFSAVKCSFTDEIIMNHAHMRALRLDGSYIKTLSADGLNVEQNIFLGEGFHASGEVWLRGAIVSGNMQCQDGQFLEENEFSLMAAAAKIGGNVFFDRGFCAKGGVSLNGSTIGGTLECGGAKVIKIGGTALTAKLAKIEGSANFGIGFEALGAVDLHGATIGGDLDCGGGFFENIGDESLVASSAYIKGSVLLREGFTALGVVNFKNATIERFVQCDEGSFDRGAVGDPQAQLLPSLNLRSAKVGAGVYLNRCKAKGVVLLDGAQIDGTLDCEGAQLDGSVHDSDHPNRPGDNAIFADAMRVNADVWFCREFNANGAVVIRGVTIGGKLDCHGGHFSQQRDPAINAASVKVGSDVYLRSGFMSKGEVNFLGATIGGSLDCDGGQFDGLGSNALTAASARIDGSVFLRAGFAVKGDVVFLAAKIGRVLELRTNKSLDKRSTLNLRDAETKAFRSEENSWPRKGKLQLHDFTFDEIDYEEAPSAHTDLAWLNLQKTHHFSPQPYEKMAEVLRKMGFQEEAVAVLIEKNKRSGPDAVMKQLQRAWHYVESIGQVPWWQLYKKSEYSWKVLLSMWNAIWNVCWYYGLGWLICYGYRPWGALAPSIIEIVIGWVLFKKGHDSGIIIPAKEEVWRDFKKYQHLPEPYPTYNALVFSLEKFVPLVKLEMGDFWIPDANQNSGKSLRTFLWFHVLAGWVLTTLWVGGLTGLLKT
jgi:hypothetical protein